MRSPDALAKLLLENRATILNAARTVLHQRHQNCDDDVVQEAMVRVDGIFERWLWRVSERVAHDHKRHCPGTSASVSEPFMDQASPTMDGEFDEIDGLVLEDELSPEEEVAMQRAIMAIPSSKERRAYVM